MVIMIMMMMRSQPDASYDAPNVICLIRLFRICARARSRTASTRVARTAPPLNSTRPKSSNVRCRFPRSHGPTPTSPRPPATPRDRLRSASGALVKSARRPPRAPGPPQATRQARMLWTSFPRARPGRGGTPPSRPRSPRGGRRSSQGPSPLQYPRDKVASPPRRPPEDRRPPAPRGSPGRSRSRRPSRATRRCGARL